LHTPPGCRFSIAVAFTSIGTKISDSFTNLGSASTAAAVAAATKEAKAKRETRIAAVGRWVLGGEEGAMACGNSEAGTKAEKLCCGFYTKPCTAAPLTVPRSCRPTATRRSSRPHLDHGSYLFYG